MTRKMSLNLSNSATSLAVSLASTLSCSMRVPFYTTSLHLDKGHGISATLSYACEKNYPICQSPCAFRLGGRGGNRTPCDFYLTNTNPKSNYEKSMVNLSLPMFWAISLAPLFLLLIRLSPIH